MLSRVAALPRTSLRDDKGRRVEPAQLLGMSFLVLCIFGHSNVIIPSERAYFCASDISLSGGGILH